jgi:hypothetical protein
MIENSIGYTLAAVGESSPELPKITPTDGLSAAAAKNRRS